MIFYDEYDNIINHQFMEKTEQDYGDYYIINSDIILELGARYGTVSCIMNQKLLNKKNQVVVEPDSRVWNALEKNKINNSCDFHIIKGFISNKKLDLENTDNCYGYGTTSVTNNNSTIDSFTLDEIELKHNLKFNVLVADCEGFLETFLDENPKLYNQLRLIIFEKDYPDKCNYEKIKNNLLNNGFICKVDGFHSVYIKLPYNFNVAIYKTSLGNFSDQECINHYFGHGYREHRGYC
jgi:FkbM family methyltransferase